MQVFTFPVHVDGTNRLDDPTGVVARGFDLAAARSAALAILVSGDASFNRSLGKEVRASGEGAVLLGQGFADGVDAYCINLDGSRTDVATSETS